MDKLAKVTWLHDKHHLTIHTDNNSSMLFLKYMSFYSTIKIRIINIENNYENDTLSIELKNTLEVYTKIKDWINSHLPNEK